MQVDLDQTPRPPKRLRNLDSVFQPPLSPTKSASSVAASEAFEVESHQSGRLSPVKQLQLLEDFEEQPVVFCNFDDDGEGEEPEDVTAMRRATQQFADGIGILGYYDINAVVSTLPPIDRMRFACFVPDLRTESMNKPPRANFRATQFFQSSCR